MWYNVEKVFYFSVAYPNLIGQTSQNLRIPLEQLDESFEIG